MIGRCIRGAITAAALVVMLQRALDPKRWDWDWSEGRSPDV